MEKSNVMVVTVGGEASELTSASVYSVAHGLARVTIHPSLHDLNCTSSNKIPPARFPFSLEEYLSHEESRAALLIMLQKLILSSASGVSAALLHKIVDLLNADIGGLNIGEFEVNAVELDILNNSTVSLLGIFTVMEHKASALSAILDVAAALGCEATRADVSSLLNALATSNGFSVKEETCSASNFNILLKGSNNVGQVQVQSVAKIPKLHASFRQVVASMNLLARVELNTSTTAGCKDAVAAAVMPLLRLLNSLSQDVTSRSALIVKSLESSDEAEVVTKYKSHCPKIYGLKFLFETIAAYMFTENHGRFLKELHQLLGRTSWMVVWEAVLAYALLQGDSSTRNASFATRRGLGEGNAIIFRHIQDTIPTWHINVKEGIFEILDPKNPKFDSFLERIKETLESSERARPPKAAEEHFSSDGESHP